jgi:6-pyruvoyl-tetrahydropterin synthase related domain
MIKAQELLKRYRVFWDEVAILLLLGFVTLLFNIRMIRDGLNGNIDMLWHMTWLQHFSHQLREGIWYPRWLAGTNYGYGSPTFVFYPPLIYYIGSALRILGLTAEQTMTALFSLGCFLSGVTCYLYGRSRWRPLFAFISAALYMTAPFMARVMHYVNSLSTVVAFAWVPLIWYLTEKSLQKTVWRVPLSLAWAGLALTHLPSLLLSLVIWLPCVLVLAVQRSFRVVGLTIFHAFLGLGLASLYLVPATLEKKLVDIDAMSGVGGGFKEFMLGTATQPLWPIQVGDNFVYIFTQTTAIAVVIGCVFLLTFLFAKTISIPKSLPRSVLVGFAFLVLLAFLMTTWSWPLWQLSPTLQRVQTPYRLFPIYSFAIAVLGGMLMHLWGNQKLRSQWPLKLIILALMMGMVLANIGLGYKISRQLPALNNPGRANLDHLQEFKTAINDPFSDKLRDVSEYRPLLKDGQAPPKPKLGEPKLSVFKGSADLQIQQWSSYKRVFQVMAREASTIRVRTYYYPAWQLSVDGQAQPIEQLSDSTIGVSIPTGSHTVALEYKLTPAFILGCSISGISALMLIAYSWRIGKSSAV